MTSPERDQEQRDHAHAEELEDAFHPDVHDEPSPVIGDSQMRAAAVEQSEAEKHHHENGAEHVKNDQRSAVAGIFVFVFLAIEHGRHGPIDDHQPKDQSAEQEDLPEAAQLEVFPSLMSQPEPGLAQITFDAQHFAKQAAHGDGHGGDEEDVDQQPLSFRFAAGDQRGQINGRSHPGDGDPENGQLQMPAFRPTVRIHFADEFHVETCRDAPCSGPKVRR